MPAHAVVDRDATGKSPLTDEQRLQMDGSISERNARQVCESGCDVLVAATGIFACPPHARARGWGR